ncbi:MAG: DUF4097 family beta strand repeat-containing protein [Bacillota bacterium]|nr:DUF4097 family beta strand repeat-containing protein [Bacillota bacterium]
MKVWHNIVKYSAIALAIILIVGVTSGIMRVISFFVPVFASHTTAEYKVYEVQNSISVLEIEVLGVDLEVRTADDQEFRVESNYKHLSVTEEGDKLLIRDRNQLHLTRYGVAVIRLYIPEDRLLEKVDIHSGAGSMSIENLMAKTIHMQLGAGKVKIQKMFAADETVIEAGAGSLTIKDSSFHNLDLNMGVGKLEFTGTLYGRNDLQLGIGSSQFDLQGSLADYSFELEKGLGDILINSERISSDTRLGQGDREIRIEGGMGQVRVDFFEGK